MDGLQWMLETGGQTLLLVAVDGQTDRPGAYPCRVIGELSALGRKAVPAMPADDGVRISRLLSEVGVPTNLLGYGYLHTALTLLLSDASLSRCISRSLYPRVAEAHEATVSGVERAIRHAICQTFARGGAERYRAALGRIASSVGDRPTNAEFIAQAAERLRMGV